MDASERGWVEGAAEVFTDGGLIGRNPSPIGGTWAWCMVDAVGRRLAWQSGRFSPEEVGVGAVTNNLTELFAAVSALDNLPEGWAGRLWTDSSVTQIRVRRTKRQAKLKGIPEWLAKSLAHQKARLGGYFVGLLAGHPSRRDIASGKKNGMPVSVHNVYCDRLCQEQATKRMCVRAGAT